MMILFLNKENICGINLAIKKAPESNDSSAFALVPRTRLELAQACAH